LDGTGLLFQPLLEALPQDIATLVIPYPDSERLGYDDLMNLVAGQLPRNEPFVLLGESFGGPLAIRVAARSPAGLTGLILVATFVTSPVWWAPRRLGRYLPASLFRLAPAWGQLRVLTSGPSTPELRRLFRKALTQVRPSVLAHRVADVLQVDVHREFQTLHMPILVIAARSDRIVPRRNLRRLVQLRSDVRVEMIDGGHLILQMAPQKAARIIHDFLQEPPTVQAIATCPPN
jgi:pimeloyl-ACP methyl ester carboxylesterase